MLIFNQINKIQYRLIQVKICYDLVTELFRDEIVFETFKIEMITFLLNAETWQTVRSDLIPLGFYL